MVARGLAWAVIGCVMALGPTAFGQAAEAKTAGGAPPASGVQVTLTGSLLCQRACVPPAWDASPNGDHTLVLFALIFRVAVDAASAPGLTATRSQ